MRKGGLPPGFGQRLQEALGISYPTRQEQWVHPASGLSLRGTRGSREEEATYGYRSSVARWDVGREKVGGAAKLPASPAWEKAVPPPHPPPGSGVGHDPLH